MKRYAVIIVSVMVLTSCVHTPPPSTQQKSNAGNVKVSRPESGEKLPTSCSVLEEEFGWPLNFAGLDLGGENELGIYTLERLAKKENYRVLDYIFNCKSEYIKSLPSGYAAGTGSKSSLARDVFAKFREDELKSLWHGKIFFQSENERMTVGKSRLYSRDQKKIIPMANFVSRLAETHPYVPEIASGANVITLNYSHLKTPRKKHHLETLLDDLQTYDVLVAIKDSDKKLYIGKTWKGKYDRSTTKFTADEPEKVIAWFFLDFSESGLAAQKKVENDRQQGPPTPEVILSPVPLARDAVREKGAFNPGI